MNPASTLEQSSSKEPFLLIKAHEDIPLFVFPIHNFEFPLKKFSNAGTFKAIYRTDVAG